jgi:hypothetical protein
MTLELATSCAGFVTAVINGTDVVPTFSAGGCWKPFKARLIGSR